MVRPCIACNQGCVGGLFDRGRLGCAVNVETGNELRLDQDRIGIADEPRKVVVVGGGLAGMEAARVAALRGHSVVLLEASPRLGGALHLAAQLPKRHGIVDIAVWLEQEIYRLGVEVRLSSYAEEDDILAETPDAVIIATGSQPRMDGIQHSNPGEPIIGYDAPHEPPRVYRRVFGSTIMLLFWFGSSLRRMPPLLRLVWCIRWRYAVGLCCTSRPI